MARTKVGILRGGPSSEYDVSLKTGQAVLRNIGEQYEPLDIFIDRTGTWHYRGRPTTPSKVLSQVDVVFNALHGEYGEDGEVQRLLDLFGTPYTGSRGMASALAMNKKRSKEIAESFGFKTPRSVIIDQDRDTDSQAKEIYLKLFQPLVVKPVGLGSSVGVFFAQGVGPLIDAIDRLRPLGQDIMVEEYRKGKEATAGVIDHFRDAPRYALLPVEIRPAGKSPIFDYHAKYDGASEEICPGNFSRIESEELQRIAVAMHDALNLRHYSRSDFIVARDGIYYLETNTLPGLTEESLFPKSLAAHGSSLGEFVDHLLTIARVV